MKMTVKQMLPIHAALTAMASMDKLDPEINLIAARNLIKLRSAHEDFQMANLKRLQAFCELDDTKAPLVDKETKIYKFKSADDYEKAEAQYQSMMKETVEFKPATMKVNSGVKKIPGILLAELLDVVFTEK